MPVRAEDVLDGRAGVFHLTFDDAYRNVLDVVPILEGLGIPATVFASTSFADTGATFAVPELVTRIRGYEAEASTLDWVALRGLAERGLEIGSHTVCHPHLTRLSDAELERELTESKQRLETELGRPCRYLAYPYGETDARVQQAARAAGYAAAFALDSNREPFDRMAVPRIDVYRPDGALRFALKTSVLGESVRRAARAVRALSR